MDSRTESLGYLRNMYQVVEKGAALIAAAPMSKVRGDDVAHFMVKFEVACHAGAVLVM